MMHTHHVQLWTARIPLIYFRSIESHQVDRVLPRFGGVQDILRPPVNIDFLHSKDGRGEDRWFTNTYRTWHSIWDAREEHAMIIPRFPDPEKRFLFGDVAHADSRLTLLPVEATQRVPSSPPPVIQVDDVPNNRGLERRL
ncbi:hypothetical protein PIB30_060427 [Stylosanthes scabra]|uniref:Uncharacterized protein n=1 Tax=Stylosanthes scabra TaxID=79078 RepID=A0ABU6TKB5_9FABA|nr:hypothetical protein [Stylosanthes scabra]